MGYTLTEKILREHLVDGSYEPGEEIGIRIDQTLTQDATGTMAYLQFEAMGMPKTLTELSVSYVDHNISRPASRTPTTTATCSPWPPNTALCFSRPGNGICHQVHLERFAEPGDTLLGSDSHTPTAEAWACWPWGGRPGRGRGHGRRRLLPDRAQGFCVSIEGRAAALDNRQGRHPGGA